MGSSCISRCFQGTQGVQAQCSLICCLCPELQPPCAVSISISMHLRTSCCLLCCDAASQQVFFFAGRICDDGQPPNVSYAWPRNCKPRNPGRPTISFYSGGVRARVRGMGCVCKTEQHPPLPYATFCILPTQCFDGLVQCICKSSDCLLVLFSHLRACMDSCNYANYLILQVHSHHHNRSGFAVTGHTHNYNKGLR